MNSKDQDFFSDPDWPTHKVLAGNHFSLELKDCIHRELHFKEEDLNHSATLYRTRDQYTIDPPSLFSEIKKEQPESCSPLPLFSAHTHHPQPQKVKLEQLSSQSLLQLVAHSKDHECSDEPSPENMFSEDEVQKCGSISSLQIHKKSDKKRGDLGFKWRKWRAPYQILDKKVKKYLVEQTRFSSIAQVSKMFGVSINNLCRWKKSCERKAGAGRKITDHILENRLITWISGEMKRDFGRCLTKKLIQQKAREWSDNPEFKASKGWFQRFANRNKFLNLQRKFSMPLKDYQSEEDSLNSQFLEKCLEVQVMLAGRRSERLKKKRSDNEYNKGFVGDAELGIEFEALRK